MKKLFFISIILFSSLSVNAQFKVHSNGYVSIQTSETPSSPVSINTSGDTCFYMAYEGNKNALVSTTFGGHDQYNWGYGATVSNMPKTQTANFFVGLKGSCHPYNQITQNYGRGYGLMGIACNFTSGYNYGVFGKLQGSRGGAAIYGSVSNNDNGINVNGIYAGYFNGNVKITGTLTVPATLNTLLLQDAVTSEGKLQSDVETKSSSSVTNCLSELDAVVYHKRQSEMMRGNSTEGDTVCAGPLVTAIEKQSFDRKHYALDADQLEKAFPDLVYEQEDGSRAINYIELIPILVQSINELSARIENMENTDVAMSRPSADVAAVESATAQKIQLYQNTPNPFSERTTIRFTLPDDTQNAYIYIFDMQGKMQKQIPIDATMQSITLNGYELSAGMYIYSLVVNGKEMDTKRMILSR